MSQQVYSINETQIVHEMIDGELVIVNLSSGTYYSTQGIGAQVWMLLGQGQSRDAIVSALVNRYAASPEEVVRDVDYLIRTLVTESLIQERADQQGVTAPPLDLSSAPAAYAMPEITKYVDMQNLLVLDPIHEVDESAGWPHVKQ